MNKLALNNQDEDKKAVTFTVNKALKDELKRTLLNSEDYSLKEKSRWLNEAIVMLRENSDCDFKEMAASAEGNGDVFDTVYMTFKQRCVFAEMRHELVRAMPDIRGPQSTIIRAAILSRLMRKI